MKVIGLDLSGPRNTADTYLVVFSVQGKELRFMDGVDGADDQQIFHTISKLRDQGPIIIGMDAPLSYNPGGGDRPSDADLRRLVREKGGRVGIMPPTMIRMVYLTLRGIALTRMLETFNPELDLRIVEVHPGACMLLRGAPARAVAAFKRDRSSRVELLQWLVVENKEPSIPVSQYAYNETRYKMLVKSDEARAEKLMKEAQHDAKARWTLYQQMAAMHYDADGDGNEAK